VPVPVTGLANGTHTIRLSKRSEDGGSTARFGGFVAGSGGALLPPPAPRARQIEWIGDSFAAGYGSRSTKHECSPAEIAQTTDVDRAFPVLTSRHYDADYQVNAYSGLGLVRNWNGGLPNVHYRTFSERARLAVDGDVWDGAGAWKPQLVVIELGGNDFSTPVKPGEPWTAQSLRAAYKTAYHGFLATLRARLGPGPTILVVAGRLATTPDLVRVSQEIVEEAKTQGDARVLFGELDVSKLDFAACQAHPSGADHKNMTEQLIAFIDAHPEIWK
jgi:hypothetical protein